VGKRILAKLLATLVRWSLVALGLILMATPLALWLAWSKTIFFAVILTGGIAAVLYCFLIEYEPPPGPQRSGPPYHRLEAWTDRTIARLQRLLLPFVQYNRLAGGARFNAAMARLKRFLFSDGDRY
jgi:hypothetical protein